MGNLSVILDENSYNPQIEWDYENYSSKHPTVYPWFRYIFLLFSSYVNLVSGYYLKMAEMMHANLLGVYFWENKVNSLEILLFQMCHLL